MTDKRAAYIVIEGAEGVGKTTIAKMVVEKLEQLDVPVRFVHEPDGGFDMTTKEIRRITQDPSYPMNSRTEALLYNAARSQSLQGVIADVRAGVTNIADRSYLTTLAVQFYGRNDIQDYQRLNDIIDFAVNGVWPDLTIVLDAPVDTLKTRAQKRNEHERFDDLDPAMLERIRAGYLWEAKQRNIPVVYATGTLTETFDAVWRHIAVELGLEKTSVSEPVAMKDLLANSPAAKVLSEKQPVQTTAIPDPAYYTPQMLPDDIQCDYCDDIERILSARRKLATKLAQHLAREDKKLKVDAALDRALAVLQPLLPVACEADKTRPLLDSTETLTLDPTVIKRLPPGYSTDDSAVKLLSVSPRNELDLLPSMLYETLDLPLHELISLVDGWPYEVKARLFEQYLSNFPTGKALERVTYEFECLTSVHELLTLPEDVRSDVLLQPLTPRYGYSMPNEVEEAELTDDYDEIFDMSLQLQSSLQARGYASAAQYATLLGHKQRWTIRVTRATNQPTAEIMQMMNDLINEYHPLLDVSQLGGKHGR